MGNIREENRAKTAVRLDISEDQIPRHVAVIMDGNGRWAANKGMPRIEGHQMGGKTVERMALCGVALGFDVLTLYSFSTENWKRPPEEIAGLMQLYRQYLIGIRPMMMKNQVHLVHIGRMENLPAYVTDELNKSIEMTAGNEGMTLALALNYSGRAEIVDAVKKIVGECKKGTLNPDNIDDELISDRMYCPEIGDPDLLIRTAGEMRISNFLLWQISYSEFYVTDTLWPDFMNEDMELAVLTYAGRARRFGGLNKNIHK